MITIFDSTGSDGDLPSSATSRSLLARVQADEPQAWERLVHLYAPLVLRWCRGHGLQDQDLADIFQDVFRAVVMHVSRFRKERADDTFRGWLRRITQNKLRDHYRRRGRDVQGVGGSSARDRMAQVPEPQTTDEERVTGASGARVVRSCSQSDPRGVRGTHMDGVLANHGGGSGGERRRGRFGHESGRRAGCEIAGACTDSGRVGRFDGVTLSARVVNR